MSEQATAGPTANVDVRESSGANLSKLAELARQAYEQKSTKNCLDLTRAILLIDPENEEAQLMRSSIRSEMHVDLENARALLRSAQLKDNPGRYSHAGDAMLRTVVNLDPDSEEAPSLLDASPSSAPEAARAVAPQSVPPMFKTFFPAARRTQRPRWIRGLKRASAAVFVGLVVVGLPIFHSRSNPVEAPLSEGSADSSTQVLDVDQNSPLPTAADVQYGPAAPADTLRVEAAVSPSVSADPDARPSPTAPVLPRPALEPNAEPAASVGTLALSSPTSTEIYIGNEYVGATPVSLELPEGPHTIEYRHGSLRRVMTHTIKGNETTKATITFDLTIPINAKPWADVYLDGAERKSLGQTPLSEVRVPIGGLLVFENPKFSAKKYRITGNESGIQVVFP